MNNCRECLIKKMIEARAFEIYESRLETKDDGSADSDYRQAENEIMDFIKDKYFKPYTLADLKEFNS